MKKQFLTLFIGCCIFLSSNAFGEELIAVMTHADYAPYFTQQKRYKYGGLIPRVTDDIFINILGIKVEHKWRPYARSIQEIKKAIYPIHIGNTSSFTKDELKDIAFVPMVTTIFGFYSYKHKQIEFKEFKDLKKYRLGSYIDAASQVFLKKYGVNVAGKTSASSLIGMIEADRLDFVTDEALGFATYAKDLFPNKTLYMSDKILLKPTGGLIFSLKHRDGKKLYELFLKGFKKYKQAGKYRKVAKEYYDYVGWDVDKFLIK